MINQNYTNNFITNLRSDAIQYLLSMNRLLPHLYNLKYHTDL